MQTKHLIMKHKKIEKKKISTTKEDFKQKNQTPIKQNIQIKIPSSLDNHKTFC